MKPFIFHVWESNQEVRKIWPSMNVRIDYQVLFFILKITGININNSCSKTFYKILSYTYPVVMIFTLVYLTYFSYLLLPFGKPMVFLTLLDACMEIFLWNLTKLRAEKIRNFFDRINGLERKIRSSTKKGSTFLPFIVFGCVGPIFVALLSTYFVQFADDTYRRLFTFDCQFESHFEPVLIRILIFVSYFTTFYQFPALLIILCYALYHYLSELINEVSFFLRCVDKRDEYHKTALVVFDWLSRLVEFADLLEEILSPISFLLLCHNLLMLTIILIPVSELKHQNIDIVYGLEIAFNFTVSVSGIIMIPLSGYRIRSAFDALKKQLNRLHELQVFLQDPDIATTELIRYMCKMDTPSMTAWSVVSLNPGLIFTLLGSCLTFGLLLLNAF